MTRRPYQVSHIPTDHSILKCGHVFHLFTICSNNHGRLLLLLLLEYLASVVCAHAIGVEMCTLRGAGMAFLVMMRTGKNGCYTILYRCAYGEVICIIVYNCIALLYIQMHTQLINVIQRITTLFS